jgi:hypothetical protein
MKRALLAIFCCVALLVNATAAVADPASDQDMAARYLRAAQSGDDDAQFYLGALYSAGIGVPRSDQEAFRWISRAAEQGHSHAMLILAGLYATGRGAQKDNVQAYKWAYIVGAGSRVDEFRNGAKQLMGVLAPKMTTDDISRATAEAGRWHATITPRGPATTSRNTALASTAPVATAAPVAMATPPAAATPAPSPPPARIASDKGDLRNGDVNGILSQVPQGLRRRFGF